MWKIKIVKQPKTKVELEVKCVLNELAAYTFAINSQELETAFNSQIKSVKSSNNFTASLMYKMTPRNQKSVDVWKLNVHGDFKEKLYQLDYEPS